MARDVFLRNLRKVSRAISPEIQDNGIRLGPDELKATLLRRGIWPPARAVDGFDPGDFPELAEPERGRLAAEVEAFRTSTISASGRPSAERDRALSAFVAILTLMQPYLEGFEVYAALKRRRFPEFIRDFAVRVGEDSTGDPAAWVWVVVDDRETVEDLIPKVEEVREGVVEALELAGITLYPYVLFRTESEQRELEASEAR